MCGRCDKKGIRKLQVYREQKDFYVAHAPTNTSRGNDPEETQGTFEKNDISPKERQRPKIVTTANPQGTRPRFKGQEGEKAVKKNGMTAETNFSVNE